MTPDSFQKARLAHAQVEQISESLAWIKLQSGKQVNLPPKLNLSPATIDAINRLVNADLTKQLAAAQRDFKRA